MVTPNERVNSAIQQVIPSFNKSKTTELGLKDTTANASTTTSQYTSGNIHTPISISQLPEAFGGLFVAAIILGIVIGIIVFVSTLVIKLLSRFLSVSKFFSDLLDKNRKK